MADVDSNLKEWSTTAGNNKPSGSTTIGTNLDDNLREIEKVVRTDLASKGADIASVAGTMDIGAVPGLLHDITGALAITGLGTVSAGIWKYLKFEGAATLTHNATSLILPGAANITTADGDIGIFISEGSGNWRCVTYFTSASGAIVSDASDTVKGRIEIAIQSEMETASSTVLAVTPGRQKFHPSAAKAWTQFTSAGVVNGSFNTSSITDTTNGQWTVIYTVPFSNTAYSAHFSLNNTATTLMPGLSTQSENGCALVARDTAGTTTDTSPLNFAAFGDQ